MSRKAYENTKVTVSKTRGEIGKLLDNAGTTGTQWTDTHDPHMGTRLDVLRFSWHFEGAEYVVRLQITSTDPQERRRLHRALFWYLKSCFEAVAGGIAHMGQLFLPFLETRTGLTVSEHMLPKLRQLESSTPFGLLTGQS